MCLSLQILDVERMLAKSATPNEILAQETHQQQMENHPVIRTLYDHSGVSHYNNAQRKYRADRKL